MIGIAMDRMYVPLEKIWGILTPRVMVLRAGGLWEVIRS